MIDDSEIQYVDLAVDLDSHPRFAVIIGGRR